jgi:hypothetical protein
MTVLPEAHRLTALTGLVSDIGAAIHAPLTVPANASDAAVAALVEVDAARDHLGLADEVVGATPVSPGRGLSVALKRGEYPPTDAGGRAWPCGQLELCRGRTAVRCGC